MRGLPFRRISRRPGRTSGGSSSGRRPITGASRSGWSRVHTGNMKTSSPGRMDGRCRFSPKKRHTDWHFERCAELMLQSMPILLLPAIGHPQCPLARRRHGSGRPAGGTPGRRIRVPDALRHGRTGQEGGAAAGVRRAGIYVRSASCSPAWRTWSGVSWRIPPTKGFSAALCCRGQPGGAPGRSRTLARRLAAGKRTGAGALLKRTVPRFFPRERPRRLPDCSGKGARRAGKDIPGHHCRATGTGPTKLLPP